MTEQPGGSELEFAGTHGHEVFRTHLAHLLAEDPNQQCGPDRGWRCFSLQSSQALLHPCLSVVAKGLAGWVPQCRRGPGDAHIEPGKGSPQTPPVPVVC